MPGVCKHSLPLPHSLSPIYLPPPSLTVSLIPLILSIPPTLFVSPQFPATLSAPLHLPFLHSLFLFSFFPSHSCPPHFIFTPSLLLFSPPFASPLTLSPPHPHSFSPTSGYPSRRVGVMSVCDREWVSCPRVMDQGDRSCPC